MSQEQKIILKHELLRMLISHLFQSRKMYAPWRNGRRLHLFIVVSNESNFIAVIYLFTQKYQMCWNLSRAKNNKCASTTCQHILSKYPISFIHSNNVIFSMSIRCKKKTKRERKKVFVYHASSDFPNSNNNRIRKCVTQTCQLRDNLL